MSELKCGNDVYEGECGRCGNGGGDFWLAGDLEAW